MQLVLELLFFVLDAALDLLISSTNPLPPRRLWHYGYNLRLRRYIDARRRGWRYYDSMRSRNSIEACRTPKRAAKAKAGNLALDCFIDPELVVTGLTEHLVSSTRKCGACVQSAWAIGRTAL